MYSMTDSDLLSVSGTHLSDAFGHIIGNSTTVEELRLCVEVGVLAHQKYHDLTLKVDGFRAEIDRSLARISRFRAKVRRLNTENFMLKIGVPLGEAASEQVQTGTATQLTLVPPRTDNHQRYGGL
jgi:hypothetical protein